MSWSTAPGIRMEYIEQVSLPFSPTAPASMDRGYIYIHIKEKPFQVQLPLRQMNGAQNCDASSESEETPDADPDPTSWQISRPIPTPAHANPTISSEICVQVDFRPTDKRNPLNSASTRR